ncbi:hypothetical protein LSTR_LSTR016878 [Laodelphax striatellus]|uniref:GPI alpha-1,4-mannosyltransferase I, catalytic subunit n=1 Tax=Laodelphax striatellus TaxID=195883 RepID=A0A482XNV8_LAOST|nr:hypothetical protein LSTR_LSTR008814 [Laodelphax striatellus]RZF47069.1 hypothetical protein LSTR_LSTR016878 [Laodelphax striatellus]
MMTFSQHCLIGLVIRLVSIAFGNILDVFTEVKYTDIDYTVFTDAASHVLKGNSPFDRPTYRYSPMLAYILTPNIILNQSWGKLLFSIGDIIVCILIRNILRSEKIDENVIMKCIYFWLYNPISVVISTRGNADSLSAILVLGTLAAMKNRNYSMAGLLHGLAIHFRIYPLVYSLALYLSISPSIDIVKTDNLFKRLTKALNPSIERLRLVATCLVTLTTVTSTFHSLYGYKFLHESFLYHFSRQDIRHNFSIFFYLQYLSADEPISLWSRVMMLLPQLLVLLAISIVFGSEKHICFAELCLTVVMVTFNSVLTCQYFVWFFCLIPLALPYLKFTKLEYVIIGFLWPAAQLSWLFPAYLLEFRGRNTFIHIFFQSIAFFAANIVVFTRLIWGYKKSCKIE